MSYDRPIFLLKPVTERNEYNEVQKDTYTNEGFRMAMATFTGGNENWQAKQLVGINEVVFTIPYEPEITQDMLVSYNGDVYEIKSIAEEGRCVRLHLTCFKRDRKQLIIIQ